MVPFLSLEGPGNGGKLESEYNSKDNAGRTPMKISIYLELQKQDP